jgi:pyrroloquinoline quinone biosynthesis protein E
VSHPEQPQRPLGLVAELTHRCPLGCPYCFNPLALEPREAELDAATWWRVFQEAAALGIRHVHLSGGEPGARHDLVDIAAHAREVGLHTSLITSGVGISTRVLRDLWEAGLDEIHVSFQDSDAVSADRIAGRRGAFQQKYAVAAEAVRLGLPLTVQVVVHRANIERIADMIDLALGLKAARIEIADVQYLGWALQNRGALTPSREQLSRAAAEIEELRRRHHGRIVIDAGTSDADWMVVMPSGRVLLRLAASSIPDLDLLSVHDHPLGKIATLWQACKALRAEEILTPQASVTRRAAASGSMGYSYRSMQNFSSIGAGSP